MTLQIAYKRWGGSSSPMPTIPKTTCEIKMKSKGNGVIKELLKLVAAVVWLIIIVVGLFVLFTH